MQRFELGLIFEMQKHVESVRYETLEWLYKRATQIGNILRKEKERIGGDTRKEISSESLQLPNNANFKKPRIYD